MQESLQGSLAYNYLVKNISIRETKICHITFIGAIVNIALSLAKLCAGIFGNSTAMIVDAIHSISDLATDVAVVVFVRVASKPSDEAHELTKKIELMLKERFGKRTHIIVHVEPIN